MEAERPARGRTIIDDRADELVAELSRLVSGGSPPDLQSAERAVARFVGDIDWATTALDAAGPGQELVYRLGGENSAGPAVYLVSDGVGVVSPPHEHETWAVIAGVAGQEINHLFTRTDPEERTVTPAETTVVGPGDIFGLTADAIHATAVGGGEPTFHVHVYGRPLDQLSSFASRRFIEAG